jgi:hypothetical protein
VCARGVSLLQQPVRKTVRLSSKLSGISKPKITRVPNNLNLNLLHLNMSRPIRQKSGLTVQKIRFWKGRLPGDFQIFMAFRFSVEISRYHIFTSNPPKSQTAKNIGPDFCPIFWTRCRVKFFDWDTHFPEDCRITNPKISALIL